MRAKTFFLDVQHAESELKVIRAKIRHYEEMGLSLASGGGASAGVHQHGFSRVEASAIGMVDATKDLRDQIRFYTRLISRAERVIKEIPQEKYRQILTYKYLCGWSFRSISDELGYHDPNSVYRAHGWALTEAQKVLNREEKRDGDSQV